MDIMFPLDATQQTAKKPNDQGTPLLDNIFLDKVVDVDEKTARKREMAATRKMGLMRQESGIEFGDGQAVPVRRPPVNTNSSSNGNGNGKIPQHHRESSEDDRIDGFVNAGEAAVLGLGREARGKTVRELSRLWMYIGGASPR